MMDEKQIPSVNRELAAKEADRRWNEAIERHKAASDYAHAGLKGLFLANGGAIVALLTFIGNVRPAPIDTRGIWWAFAWFSLGLATILLTHILGFVSQTAYMQACLNLSWEADSAAHGTGHSYNHGSHERRGSWAELFAVGLVLVSLVLFVIGAFVTLNAIT